MSEPVITARRHPVTAAEAKYPLATLSGISRLAQIMDATQVWASCTKPQRVLLDVLCRPTVDALLEQGSLTAEEMPTVPERTTSASRAAMLRRGLIDEQGRLTARAVHAWFYAARNEEDRRG